MLIDGFSEQGARDFLKVYDLTITYARLSNSDKATQVIADDGLEDTNDNGKTDLSSDRNASQQPAPRQKDIKVMAGERELTTGLLAKDASFRLIVTGKIGAKEIDRLIAKLQLDKEILAEQDDDQERAN